MDIWECMYERRSVREFVRGKEIPQDILEKIMRSAWYSLPAPAIYEPMNFPWRFIINRKDQEVKDRLGDAGKEVAMTMFGSRFEFFGPEGIMGLNERQYASAPSLNNWLSMSA